MQSMIFTAFSALIVSAASAATSTCASESAAQRPRPLIELFTSEGCSSCPPADRWLSGLRNKVEKGDFSAIAWHVDYWDPLGWKDLFSIAAASALSTNPGTQTQTSVLAWPTGSSAVTAFVQNHQGAILQSTQIFLDRCALE